LVYFPVPICSFSSDLADFEADAESRVTISQVLINAL